MRDNSRIFARRMAQDLETLTRRELEGVRGGIQSDPGYDWTDPGSDSGTSGPTSSFTISGSPRRTDDSQSD
jgi:hypothetical protein